METVVDPSDIQPYVSFGPSSEYSVSVKKDTFDISFLGFTLIFGGIIITIAIVTIILAYNQTKFPPIPKPTVKPPPNPTINNDLGASPHIYYPVDQRNNIDKDGSALTTYSVCNNTENTHWDGEECHCIPPFFGPYCDRERHDKKYFGVGLINETSIKGNVLKKVTSNGKSFNNNGNINTCSNYCDTNRDCIGFLYNGPGRCTLLKDNVIISEENSVPYSPYYEPTLYMKSSDNLKFHGRIFISRYHNTFPPRFWLVNETSWFAQLIPKIINEIHFYPELINMIDNYTGIYCRNRFTISDIPHMLRAGQTSEWYIHYPGEMLKVPSAWQYSTPLYAVYV